MKFTHVFTDEQNQDFIDLAKELWDEYYENAGSIVNKYQKVNNVEGKQFVILVFDENNRYNRTNRSNRNNRHHRYNRDNRDNKNNKNSSPIACGSFKELSNDTVEIKRVFVKKLYRNNGLATFIMELLEKEINQRSYDFSVLVTGVRNLPSQSLYKKLGYSLIEGFGIYKGDPDSLCFKKEL